RGTADASPSAFRPAVPTSSKTRARACICWLWTNACSCRFAVDDLWRRQRDREFARELLNPFQHSLGFASTKLDLALNLHRQCRGLRRNSFNNQAQRSTVVPCLRVIEQLFQCAHGERTQGRNIFLALFLNGSDDFFIAEKLISHLAERLARAR